MAAITRLQLTDFRSHAATEIDARPGAIVITGENGAGKTNILEALSLLGPGRGLRGTPLRTMRAQGGPGGWSIAATLRRPAATSRSAPARRATRPSGASCASTARAASGDGAGGLAGDLVWLTPAMDRLFAETPAARRRFLDRLVLALHPGHGHEACATTRRCGRAPGC